MCSTVLIFLFQVFLSFNVVAFNKVACGNVSGEEALLRVVNGLSKDKIPFGLEFFLDQTTPTNTTLDLALLLETGHDVISSSSVQFFLGEGDFCSSGTMFLFTHDHFPPR